MAKFARNFSALGIRWARPIQRSAPQPRKLAKTAPRCLGFGLLTSAWSNAATKAPHLQPQPRPRPHPRPRPRPRLPWLAGPQQQKRILMAAAAVMIMMGVGKIPVAMRVMVNTLMTTRAHPHHAPSLPAAALPPRLQVAPLAARAILQKTAPLLQLMLMKTKLAGAITCCGCCCCCCSSPSSSGANGAEKRCWQTKMVTKMVGPNPQSWTSLAAIPTGGRVLLQVLIETAPWRMG